MYLIQSRKAFVGNEDSTQLVAVWVIFAHSSTQIVLKNWRFRGSPIWTCMKFPVSTTWFVTNIWWQFNLNSPIQIILWKKNVDAWCTYFPCCICRLKKGPKDWQLQDVYVCPSIERIYVIYCKYSTQQILELAFILRQTCRGEHVMQMRHKGRCGSRHRSLFIRHYKWD